MGAAARAIIWEFRRRHRLALAALAVYAALFGAIKLLILDPGHPIRLNPPNGLAGFLIAPVTVAYFYFVGVFSYGLSGDLAARQSIFPSRMFTLPVTTRALAGWPMLYGAAASASLWWATVLFARWPGGVAAHLPWLWPALLAVTWLAWMQALMWMPYGLPGLRVMVAALWLVAVDAIVLVAFNYHARELTMAALLAPQIPVAYLLAWNGLARARRGDTPDWRGAFVRTNARARATRHFLSPSRAQAWLEWRRHGRVLPAMVALVVPVELLLLFIPGNDTAPVVFLTLMVVLITPPLLAIFAAAALSTSTTFILMRPLTSVSLVAAKIRMTIWSTAAAWLLVIVCVPVALALSGTMPVLVERARAGIDVTGTPRASAVAVLVFAALFAATWKRLVQSLCIGLTGRDWIVKSAVLLALVFLVAAGPLAEWIYFDSAVQSAIWNGLPWILAFLVCVKVCAGFWVAIRLYDSRLLTDRALITGAACWLITVAALYGVLEWFAASPLVPRYFLGAIAILLVPLARASASPLALAWSRHR